MYLIPGLLPVILPTAALAVLYWVRHCYLPASWSKSAVKTTSVAFLALSVWLFGGPVWLGIALALCALGDYFLSRDDEGQFLAGMGAFAAGHIAYIILFLSLPGTRLNNLIMSETNTFIGLGILAFGVVMAVTLFLKAGDLRWPVMGYIPVIITMGITALMVHDVGPMTLVFPAAMLFMISDVILSFEMFVFSDKNPLRRIAPFVVWPTYWGAQILFFLAFVGMPTGG